MHGTFLLRRLRELTLRNSICALGPPESVTGDPTSTHGKKAEEAKKLQLEGWDYPKHLAGRSYGLVASRFNEAHPVEPVSQRGENLQCQRRDDMQKEVANVALAVANAVTAIRAGKLVVDPVLTCFSHATPDADARSST